MDWLAIVTLLYVACMAAPFFYIGVQQLRRLKREREKEHAVHQAYMEGLAEGADLHRKTRRIRLRERIFLR